MTADGDDNDDIYLYLYLSLFSICVWVHWNMMDKEQKELFIRTWYRADSNILHKRYIRKIPQIILYLIYIFMKSLLHCLLECLVCLVYCRVSCAQGVKSLCAEYYCLNNK